MLCSSIDGREFVGDLRAHVRESKPLTNVKQACCPITSVTTIAERLKEARLELGLSQEEFAARAGVSNGTIGNIEAGTRHNPRALLEIAAAAGVTADWLKNGKSPKRPIGWMPQQHTIEGRDLPDVAHSMIHLESDDEPITLSWEFILSAAPLPRRFRLAVPDDAMAPNAPRGTGLIFSTEATPKFGRGILVEDSTGQRYVRRYAQGPGGRWVAEPRNSAYLAIDSADGAKVLAVVVAIEVGDL